MLKRAGGHTVAWFGVLLAGWLWLVGGAEVAWGQVPVKPPGGGVEAPRGGFHMTPSLTVDERYDNNILFTQRKVEDYATDIEPRFVVTAEGRAVDLSANLGARWTEFARNPKLSYFSSNGGLTLKADTLTGQMVQGLGLVVTDNYFYTKDFPVFAPVSGPNPVASGGIQTSRVTTFANVAGAKATYELSPRTKLTGDYTNSRYEFSGTTTPLFNSTINAWTAGTEHMLSPTTTLLGDYMYQRFSFSRDGTLETHGVDAGAREKFKGDLTVDGRAGVTYLPSVSDRLTYTFNVGVTKKSATTDVEGRYIRAIANSGGLAPLVTTQNIASLLVTHRLTPAFTTTLAGFYATSKSIPVSTVDFRSYGVTPALSYALAKWATVFTSYSYYKQEVLGAVGISLNRTQVTVGLTLTWQ